MFERHIQHIEKQRLRFYLSVLIPAMLFLASCGPVSADTPPVIPTPTPIPTPNWCNGTCGSNSNCQSGYFCYNGYCRIPSCRDSVDCSCATPTPTPIEPQVLGATAPPVLPKTGGGIEGLLALFGTGGLGIFLIKRYRLI